MFVGSRVRGFSLLELLITVGVVAMGLLGLVSVLAFGVKASRTGELATLAVGHSVHVLELIRSRNLDFGGFQVPPSAFSGINDPPAARKAMNAPPFQNDFPEGMAFTRNVSIVRLSDDATDYRYDVLRITCTIYWIENGEERGVSFEALHAKP